ncbi:ABC transporter substrate-binding protein [Gorillibacterium timonense]|uniref:ABC transporter substrate-binding protein n=1 Tax=Gorillibacterium timonense TaxID=1689269 RepID=UPI00071CA896|nr:extracellular solute-binding protein [Gorillibacterium timonense]
MNRRVVRIALLFGLMMMSGCSRTLQVANPIPVPAEAPVHSDTPSSEQKLVILAPSDMPPAWQAECRKLESFIPITWINASKTDSGAYLDALSKKQPPDLILFDASLLGELRGNDVFEDLASSAYGAFSYNTVFPGLRLDAYKSLDGHRLVAFPLSLYAQVTFYRADLISAAGYPADPDELGKLLEDPKQWLQLGMKLKSEGLWIQEQITDGIDIAVAGQSYFNEDGSFVRSTGELVKKLDAVQRAARASMAAQINLDSRTGYETLKAGKYAMLYGAEWRLDALREADPEKAEEWRLTRLPFNAYGPSEELLFAIPSEGSNPEKAWAFAKAWLEDEKAKGEATQARKWYSRFPNSWPTPLDKRADKLWRATLTEYLFNDSKTPTQAVATAYARTIPGLGADYRILFEEVARSSR